MSALDWLIVAPLIPLAPLVITWWLPWEQWIPWGKLPKLLIGPYLLYVSFAMWHFSLGWVVLVPLGVGAGFCVAATWEMDSRKGAQSKNEP